MSTKIHALVDALGNPLRFILTPGQVNDMIAELPADHVLADKGYDSKALRETIVNQGAVPVIPPRKTSPQVPCDFALYCETKPRRTLLPETQALQADRNTLRPNTKGIPVHPLPRQRIHLDQVNVNAI